jgi:phosphoserine aminotransferase
VNYDNTGVSVMEMSHRSPPFERILKSTEGSLRRLLGVHDGFSVLFMQGGASLQFSALVMNLVPSLTGDTVVEYVVSGVWSDKAHQEASVRRGLISAC